MTRTQRPLPWNDSGLVSKRNEILAPIAKGDTATQKGLEKDIEALALARDCRTCDRLARELKAAVRQERGADTTKRKQLAATKQLAKQLRDRLRELARLDDLVFPAGQVIPGTHSRHSKGHSGGFSNNALPIFTDAEINEMFPPLL